MRQWRFLLSFCGMMPMLVFAQGPELLRQQYNQYPYDHEYYRIWNIGLQMQPHLSNTVDRLTGRRLNIDFGANVYYRFNKTVGLQSGLHYQRISYGYKTASDNSVDRLRFLRFPLLLTLHPVRRMTLALGGTYHWFLKATGMSPPAEEPLFYPQKTFVNSIGLLASLRYRLWKKWSLSVNYGLHKRNHIPFSRVTQNFQGLGLGIHYTLLHPTQRPPQ